MPPKSSFDRAGTQGSREARPPQAPCPTANIPAIDWQRDGAVETSDSRFSWLVRLPSGPKWTFRPVTERTPRVNEPVPQVRATGTHVTQPHAHFRALVFCLVFESPHQIF